MANRKTSPEQRLMGKVHMCPMSGCWLWTGSVTSAGYGSMRNEKGVVEGPHSVSFRVFVGDLPPGACVLHRCDTPLCVNPSHLWSGSRADNNADKAAKGRASKNGGARGEKNYNTRLTEVQVIAIHASNESESSLSAVYGVNRTQVGRIKRGERWRHLFGGVHRG